ncbi:MAG: hypothetical protein CME62_07365 [Halobacteriovoraceae bacterium]|nr:hypothetical protein [Halobacteriovoraceae bacterium]
MHIIRTLLNIYILIIIADAILSYFPQFRHHEVARFIRKAANYTLDPIRKLLPEDLPIDISPIIVIVLINILMKLW